MNAPDASWPLSWPISWPRSRSPECAKFGGRRQSDHGNWTVRASLTIAQARERLIHELALLGATNRVLSTNIRTRGDGLPYSNAAEPADHGVAVYFRLKGEPRVLACDKWDRVADNIAALAKHIEAARGQIRWGVGTLEQAFGGYKALPAVGEKQPWWVVLALPESASRDEIDRKRNDLLRKHHPDMTGGSHTRAAEINAAYQEAIA